jgi:hypothetical protein
VVVDPGKARAVGDVWKRDVVHLSKTGGPLPAHELAAAAIAGWRRWGPALEEWARASQGMREPEGVAFARGANLLPIEHNQSPPAASVGGG